MADRKDLFTIIDGKKNENKNEEENQFEDLEGLDFENIEEENEEGKGATLNVEGETLHLTSFLLSGESEEGKRVVFTYRCDPDEMLLYLKTMEILVDDKFKSLLELGE